MTDPATFLGIWRAWDDHCMGQNHTNEVGRCVQTDRMEDVCEVLAGEIGLTTTDTRILLANGRRGGLSYENALAAVMGTELTT